MARLSSKENTVTSSVDVWYSLLRLAVVLTACNSASVLGSTPTSVTVTATPNPSVLGQPVALTAAVSPSTAVGRVTFYDGVVVLGIGTILNGQAKLFTSLLPSGARSLRAYYGGDASYTSATSDALTQIVVARPQDGFQNAVSYNVGSGPYGVSVGDLNGDGRPDLIVPNSNDNNVSVLLGNGDGTFRAAVNYETGMVPLSAAVADFNGDGRADVAVGNNNGGNVSVLLGKGDGTFQTAANYPGGGPFVAVADFNGDGNADLAAAPGGSGTLNLLLGNGDGTFQQPVRYAAQGQSIAIGDFNGDGKPDIAVASPSYIDLALPKGGVSILLNNGYGTLNAAVSYSAGNSPVWVAVGDFNGDGKADLTVANTSTESTGGAFSPGGVSVLLGNGDGTFRPAVNYATGSYALSIAVGDFNGDGNADLAVADTDISVLLGNGDGTFQPALNYGAGIAPWSVVVGDFSADGRSDLAVDSPSSNKVNVLLGEAPPGPSSKSGGIGPVYSSSNTIQPGSWASIYGSNLAYTTATWNGDFPTSLGGVTVTVNGKPAYLWYVSPTQINLQAPDDTAVGTVNVTVTNGGGSGTSTATLGPISPSFSVLGGQYVAGIILRSDGSGTSGGGTYDIIGPTGMSLGYPTVAAEAGDSVELFGVGFGPTVPPVPAGQLYSGAADTANAVQIMIGATAVTPSFAGLTSAGLYQINLTIPAGLGTGSVPIVATVGGVQTQSGVSISLQ